MWDIIWILYRSVSVGRHFLLQAPHWCSELWWYCEQFWPESYQRQHTIWPGIFVASFPIGEVGANERHASCFSTWKQWGTPSNKTKASNSRPRLKPKSYSQSTEKQHTQKPENLLDRKGREWRLARSPNLTSASCDLDLWPPVPQSWSSHPLALWTTCANLQQFNLFIRFQNIMFTILVTDMSKTCLWPV